MFGNKGRRFNLAWYDAYGEWLEYSARAHEAFCLCCYLFKDEQNKKGGGDAFVTEGFTSWNKQERLKTHEGETDNSSHYFVLKNVET